MSISETPNSVQNRITGFDARQPSIFTFNDWTRLDPSNFSYSTSDTMTVTTYDTSVVFKMTDIIRIKQTGDTNYRYFVLSKISTNNINITGGDDYVFANLPIIEIGIANKNNASGLPFGFYYTFPAIYDEDYNVLTYTNPDGLGAIAFSAENGKIDSNINIGFLNIPASTFTLVMRPPFKYLASTASTNAADLLGVCYKRGKASSGIIDILVQFVIYSSGGNDYPEIWITRPDGSAFPTGQFDMFIDYRFILK